MHVLADSADGSFDRIGGDLRSGTLDQHQLGSAGEEAGRPRLIHLDVRVLVADDSAKGWAKGGKCEAIGGGAGAHPERSDIALEEVGEGEVQLLAPLVAV